MRGKAGLSSSFSILLGPIAFYLLILFRHHFPRFRDWEPRVFLFDLAAIRIESFRYDADRENFSQGEINGKVHQMKPMDDVRPVIDAGSLFNYARQSGMIPNF
jgi:hypothetical protein